MTDLHPRGQSIRFYVSLNKASESDWTPAVIRLALLVKISRRTQERPIPKHRIGSFSASARTSCYVGMDLLESSTEHVFGCVSRRRAPDAREPSSRME